MYIERKNHKLKRKKHMKYLLKACRQTRGDPVPEVDAVSAVPVHVFTGGVQSVHETAGPGGGCGHADISR